MTPLVLTPKQNQHSTVMPHIDEPTMKRILITTFIALKCLFTFGQSNETLECILFDCLVENFKDKGINIKYELNELENYLIKNKLIESSSGEAYFNFYKKVEESNDFPVILDKERFSKISNVNLQKSYSNDCLEKIFELNPEEIKTSKFYKLYLINQGTNIDSELSLSNIAKNITSILTPKDLETPYYRASLLLSIIHISQLESGFESKVIIKENNNPELSIKISSENKIFIGNKEISIEELKTKLEEFILTNKNKNQIIFSSEKEARYSFYIKVQECIMDVYRKVRESESKKIFKKSFQDLSENEKNEILSTYPSKIFDK